MLHLVPTVMIHAEYKFIAARIIASIGILRSTITAVNMTLNYLYTKVDANLQSERTTRCILTAYLERSINDRRNHVPIYYI